MEQQEVVIRGGSVVTAYGIQDADIWIVDGKIRRIAKDTLTKSSSASMGMEIDASGMYLLPGFVAVPDYSMARIKEPTEYKEAMRDLIRMGYTSLIDTIYPESWMDMPQVKYQQTVHFNSQLDYVWHIGMEASRFSESELLEWCRHGYTSIHIKVRKPEEITSIDWETISPLLTSYKAMLHLHTVLDPMTTKDQKAWTRQTWMELTRYWKVRTVMTENKPSLDADWYDPFHHIFRLRGEGTDRAMRQLHRNWYGSLPVAATLQDIRVDYRRKWCEEEELLCLLVRLASANMAKAAGLYPRKGVLTPGADADIVFLKKENWLTKYDLSTILNFSEMYFPTSVMSNGKWIYRDMRFVPSIGMGRCLFDSKPYAYVI